MLFLLWIAKYCMQEGKSSEALNWQLGSKQDLAHQKVSSLSLSDSIAGLSASYGFQRAGREYLSVISAARLILLQFD